jgi:hypothetical protein
MLPFLPSTEAIPDSLSAKACLKKNSEKVLDNRTLYNLTFRLSETFSIFKQILN